MHVLLELVSSSSHCMFSGIHQLHDHASMKHMTVQLELITIWK